MRLDCVLESNILQKCSKKLPKGPQDGHLGPVWRLLAPSWLQVGAILPHLGEILVDPSPAKIDQNQPRQLLRDFLSQGRPQELPDPLQTSIFKFWASLLERFVIDVDDLCLQMAPSILFCTKNVL